MRDPQNEIVEMVEARMQAVSTGDVDTIVAQLAPEVVSFDVVVPLRNKGTGAVRQRLERWFASYEGSIACETRDLFVGAGERIGFSHALMRFRGTLKTGKAVDMWVRSTMGFERRDGHWLIVHEHMSDPMDPDSGQSRIDLTP